MTTELKEAIEVLKDYRKGDFVGDINLCDAIDTVIEELENRDKLQQKTVCPECLKQCTHEELKMFGGLCEDCSTDFD